MALPEPHRVPRTTLAEQQWLLRFVGHQPWLRGRDRILRFFSHPDRQASAPFEVDFFGRPYTGDLSNFIDWTVFYYGAFGLHELRLLADLAATIRDMGKPVNFFDVGANIGQHSLFMADFADEVFAFEPFAVVRAEMERKLAHARVDNVHIFPVALGERTKTGVFSPPTGANQGTGTLGELLPENASTEKIAVDVVRGDACLAANDLPPVTLLKIDVEGYETQVLEGLQQTLLWDRPPILLEIQHDPRRGSPDGAGAAGTEAKGEQVRELLYPDHLIFEVGSAQGQFVLKPFDPRRTEEALVVPGELAELLRETHRRWGLPSTRGGVDRYDARMRA